MSKKKVDRLHKPYYVADEWGHTDKVLVQKVNELVDIINHQDEVIRKYESIVRNGKKGDRK